MDDKLLDHIEVGRLFKRWWWIIVLTAVITTSLGVYKVSKLRESYQGYMTVFIGRDVNAMQYYSEPEIENYNNLIGAFSEFIKRGEIADEILKKHKINTPAGAVKNSLAFSIQGNSPTLSISYYSGVNNEIEDILEAICSEFLDQIKRIMPEVNPEILSEPSVATIYPNKKKLPVMAFGVGIVIGIGAMLVIDYFDDKIRSSKRLKEVLPVPVLGEIPSYDTRG